MLLITAAEVRQWLPGLATSAEGTLLTSLIAATERHAARYCGVLPIDGVTSFESAEYTIQGDDDGVVLSADRKALTLPVPIITEIASVAVDPLEVWGSETLLASTDYRSRDRRIVMRPSGVTGAWPADLASVQVMVTAGYTSETAPEDLKAALAQIAAAMFRERHRAGLTNESEGGRSVGLTDGWPAMAQALLAPFRLVL